MDMKPDFDGRFKRVVNHQEADRVPLCEVLIAYPIQSQFLGREVTSEDVEAQVEFWAEAGYDFIPIPVSMMTPGGVTTESRITKVLREKVQKENPDETDPKAWNLEFTSFIHEREDFEAFPWEAGRRTRFYEPAQGGTPAPRRNEGHCRFRKDLYPDLDAHGFSEFFREASSGAAIGGRCL